MGNSISSKVVVVEGPSNWAKASRPPRVVEFSRTRSRRRFLREVKTLRILYASRVKGVQRLLSCEVQEKVLRTEYAGRALRQVVGHLSLQEKVHILLQVVRTLRLMHRKRFSHNDLSDASICVRQTTRGSYRATIVGFEQATEFGTSPLLPGKFDQLLWNAPEVFQGSKTPITPVTDCYSVGWVLVRWLRPQDVPLDLRAWIVASRSTDPQGRLPLRRLHRSLRAFRTQLADDGFEIY